jgi:peptidoglycan/LPS O-acetylase OafA/YrhL
MDRVELLDWIRALAIVLVVFGHAAPTIAPGGSVGVSVFFVLSGYLITAILLSDEVLTPRNVARFYLRRIARIYPMYVLQLAALLAAFWLIRSRHFEQFVSVLPRLLTFTGGYEDVFPVMGVAVLWTLHVEFWFYVTFPLLLWVAVASRQVTGVLAIGAAVSIAAKLGGLAVPTLLYYDHFLIGAGVCAAIKFNAVPRFLQHRQCVYLGLAMILLSAVVPYPGEWNFAWYAQSLMAALGTGAIIAGGQFEPPRGNRPSLAFIGRISYSMYLVHAIVLDVFPRITTNVPLYLGLVTAISAITYCTVEQPIIRLVHRHVRFRASPTLGATIG